MKEAIGEWITNIAVIAVLGALVDIILPNSSFRKYTEFLFGLVILVMFLQPILQFMNSEQNFVATVFHNALAQNAEATAFQSSRVEEGQKQWLEGMFKESLEKDLAFQLEKATGLENISVAVTFHEEKGETDLSDMERIDVSAAWKDPAVLIEPVAVGIGKGSEKQPAIDTERISEIKKILSDRYELEEDKIFVNGK
jgi:stage III sporulation protein AF